MKRPLLAVLATLARAIATAAAAAAACNGHAELCDRRYSNVTFLGSHDSAFVGTSVADNQETSVADQLAQGVRFLQAQTHLASDNHTIELCHTLCLLEDAGPLAAYLSTIKTFLDANTQEVVTLLLTNQDGQSGTAFDAVFQSSGIKGYAFTPAGNLTLDQWPTLGQMISMGQRLVVFMDFPAGAPVPYILNEFQSYIFETPFDTTDPTFPQCAIDRPPGASAAGRMILVNHFLDTNLSGILIPNQAAANVTNSAASITAQANLCSGLYQQTPNFILLDWISIGDAMSVQAMMNGWLGDCLDGCQY
ncbi:PLC-like phosphodiesterase [Cryphonectria parasitica EP155]|uniref:PLC-like phosphodiesterase n=1 Tax=Cryphonectria parasitica (strain ATCC 38755 / EP155) TaxID=660469 RepID=A0A9P4YCM3_CRYP1|nr:PLC-like phosphodiesterase [Cryphonectria parasitica EP155]KAF3770427.1 PLC-like phosphodiesterase [Cryphonectria parasitica EP155]